MVEDDLSAMRREYRHAALREDEVLADPIAQFGAWFEDAVGAGLEMPNAMVLATADRQGRPAARYVLMKGFDQEGFVFFTHSTSAKGAQLAENPRAALVFYWEAMHRQVRVEGDVAEVTGKEADEYFRTRPHGSRLSVWVAPQSSEVPGREFLERRYAELESRYPEEVPRPKTWTGYRVRPTVIEFWQGRENRLHDRILYSREDGSGWKRVRLAP